MVSSRIFEPVSGGCGALVVGALVLFLMVGVEGELMGQSAAGSPQGAQQLSTTVLPQVYAPTRPRLSYSRYPWREEIVTTIFWIGETPTPNNPTPNNKSSWDTKWEINFGGRDHPERERRAWDFRPKDFEPGQNPFYIALPFNDVTRGRTKPESRTMIPWFREAFVREGQSVCKGRWLAIRYGNKVCYAQWEDCGPFTTEDVQYVFGNARPTNTRNNGAGLDVSPAVRDFLGIQSGAKCDWRFVELSEVPDGPWRKYGENNPFVQLRRAGMTDRVASGEVATPAVERLEELRSARDAWFRGQGG
jgi:hypothetical protein